jgi:hypothetical protein
MRWGLLFILLRYGRSRGVFVRPCCHRGRHSDEVHVGDRPSRFRISIDKGTGQKHRMGDCDISRKLFIRTDRKYDREQSNVYKTPSQTDPSMSTRLASYQSQRLLKAQVNLSRQKILPARVDSNQPPRDRFKKIRPDRRRRGRASSHNLAVVIVRVLQFGICRGDRSD